MARSYSWAVQLSLCITGRHDADQAGAFSSGAPYRWEWSRTQRTRFHLRCWLCWLPEGMIFSDTVHCHRNGAAVLVFGILVLQETGIKCPLKNDSRNTFCFILFYSVSHSVLSILLLNCCYVPEFPHSEPLRSSSYWPSLRTVLPWLCSCQCLKKTAITPIQAWWVLTAILPIISINSTIETPYTNNRLTKIK